MDFAEKRLRRNPNQAELLKNYVARSTDNERGRIEAFLKSELDRRPVDIPWHRAYQTIAELNNHEAELVSLYDKYLAADPSNASLLYLRGRIDPDWEKQELFYRRAIEADPKIGWPWIAIAARASSEGRWDDCLEGGTQGTRAQGRRTGTDRRVRPRSQDGQRRSERARRGVSRRNDRERHGYLGNPLARSTPWRRRAGKARSIRRSAPGPRGCQAPCKGRSLRILRAWGCTTPESSKSASEFCDSRPLLRSAPSHLHALIALGRMKEATDDAVFGTLWNDPLNLLAVSVGFGLDGKPEDSARWREKAVSLMNKVGGATDVGKAAKLLRAPEPPSIKEVRQVYLPPANRAVILAALADQFPAERAMYLAEAAQFNISRKPSLSPDPAGHREEDARPAMTRQDFDALVRRIEDRYAGRQAALERATTLWVALGLAGLLSWLLLVTGMGLLLFVLGAFAEAPLSIVLIVMGVPLTLYGVLQTLYILRVELAPPEGHLVAHGEAPALRLMLEGLRRDLQCRSFDEVRITHGPQRERCASCRASACWAGRERSSRSVFPLRGRCLRTSSRQFWRMNSCMFPRGTAGASAGSIGSTGPGATSFERMQRPAGDSFTRLSRSAISAVCGLVLAEAARARPGALPGPRIPGRSRGRANHPGFQAAT